MIFETFHGPGKSWKNESLVKKSPLYVSYCILWLCSCSETDDCVSSRWYNVPPSSTSTSNSKTKASTPKAGPSTLQKEPSENSTPLNFDTFVPTHDPSLALHIGTPSVPAEQEFASWAQNMASSSSQLVDQDEAFQRALTAMYWSGYYTAVYHVCLVFERLRGFTDRICVS